MLKNIKVEILIVGSGTMGSGIAHSFAQKNFQVYLFDTNEEALKRALLKISSNIDRQINRGTLQQSEKESILSNITLISDLKNLSKNIFLAVEAVPENLEIKREVFRLLNTICSPETILASNTSSISITQLASFSNRPDKVIGMHFMNPVPIMQLVEVISGLKTSEDTKQKIISISTQMGKTPISTADFPGFIANRILMPMINEAIYALQEHVAGIAEIDQIMKLGMAHPMGPLQLADYIGLDICLDIMKVLENGFSNPKYAPSPLLVKMVHAGLLGQKSKMGFYDWSDSKNIVPNSIIR